MCLDDELKKSCENFKKEYEFYKIKEDILKNNYFNKYITLRKKNNKYELYLRFKKNK